VSLYWSGDGIQLHHGRFEDVLPGLAVQADLAVVDPPYGETSLDWDVWPNDWPNALANFTRSMWVMGSMRMFLDHAPEFDRWRLSQDVVWHKQNGSGFHTDRFRRVHEHATHWYQGAWQDVFKSAQFTSDEVPKTVRHKTRPAHTGHIDATAYQSFDGGPRLQTSVIAARNMHGRAINETEKPAALIGPLVAYGSPTGGLVLDPMCGSGVVLEVARTLGMRAIGIEARESQCEATAKRLDQTMLTITGSD
jgi:site-specific DNA-methyltransferase (adenine-specific)